MRKKKYDPRKAANKYKKDYARMAEETCREGFSYPKLAKLFAVSRKTILNWRKEHPEFVEAIQRGRDFADTEKVERSLFTRAIGFKFTETHREANKRGKLHITKTIRKYVSPDTTAQIFWLTNRNRDRWKHVKEIKHGGGDKPIEVIVKSYKDDG